MNDLTNMAVLAASGSQPPCMFVTAIELSSEVDVAHHRNEAHGCFHQNHSVIRETCTMGAPQFASQGCISLILYSNLMF